jgi:hypothetical protein
MGNLLYQLRLRRFGVGSALMVSLLGAAIWLTVSNLEEVTKPGLARQPNDSLSEIEAPTTASLQRSRPALPDAGTHTADGQLPDETINLWLGRASRDPAGTLEQVMALDDPHQRQELLDWILSAWTIDGRSPALEWFETTAPRFPEDRSGEVLDLLVGSWAAEDAESAIEWVNHKLDEPHRTRGLQAIASSWGHANPQGMETWILAQDGPQDFWVQELVQGLIMSDPRKAMEWSTRLSDTVLAKDIQQNVIQSWLLSDPAAADDFLRQHLAFEVETKPETAIAE